MQGAFIGIAVGFDESKHTRDKDGKFSESPDESSKVYESAQKSKEYSDKTDRLASNQGQSVKFMGRTVKQDRDGDGYFYYDARVKMSDLKSNQAYRNRPIVDNYKKELSSKTKSQLVKVGLTVHPKGGKFLVDDGHHRMDALRELGFKGDVTVRVRMPD